MFRDCPQQELALSSKIFMEGSVETMMSARHEVAKLRGLYVRVCVCLCLCIDDVHIGEGRHRLQRWKTLG